MHIFGYQTGIKGNKLYDLNSHSILVSENVVFHEKESPFSKQGISKQIAPSTQELNYDIRTFDIADLEPLSYSFRDIVTSDISDRTISISPSSSPP